MMKAITYRKFASYWQTTAVADSLLQYISMDFQGLSKSVAELAGDKGYSDEQIKDRNYPACIADYGGEILLVGISYEKDAAGSEKKHSCKIEKWEKA